MIENNYWNRINDALARQDIDPGDSIDSSCSKCRICGTGKEEPNHLMSDCKDLEHLRLKIFGNRYPEPPYTNIKVYQLVAFLKVINLPSLEMKPYLEQYNPTTIPDEARPTPPPIVEGAELVSDDSEDDQAVLAAAEAAGGNMLHNYLLTSNNPPLPAPGGRKFY